VCAATAPAAPEPMTTTSNESERLRVSASPSTTAPAGRSSSAWRRSFGGVLMVLGLLLGSVALAGADADERGRGERRGERRRHLAPHDGRLRVEERAHRLQPDDELAHGVDRAREQALEHALAVVFAERGDGREAPDRE